MLLSLLLTAWWLNVMDVAITWYGMIFLDVREGNQALAALMRRIGRGPVFSLKVLAVSFLIGYLAWVDAEAGHIQEFAAALRLGSIVMVLVFAAVNVWNLWVTRRKLDQLREDRRDWIETVTRV